MEDKTDGTYSNHWPLQGRAKIRTVQGDL